MTAFVALIGSGYEPSCIIGAFDRLGGAVQRLLDQNPGTWTDVVRVDEWELGADTATRVFEPRLKTEPEQVCSLPDCGADAVVYLCEEWGQRVAEWRCPQHAGALW